MIPDALERLHAAYLMAREGRHQEALDEYAWFHAYALDQPGLRAVRLSFALAHWTELAEVYPPARQALEAQRDRHLAAVLGGAGGWKSFQALAAINERLGLAQQTYATFRELSARDPETASACGRLAMNAIIEARDFALAERYLPDPEHAVHASSERLNQEVAGRRTRSFTPAPRIAAAIHNYVQDVKQLLTVLEGCGRKEEARHITRLAPDLVRATTVRRAVRAALLPGARPWYERSKAWPMRGRRLAKAARAA